MVDLLPFIEDRTCFVGSLLDVPNEQGALINAGRPQGIIDSLAQFGSAPNAIMIRNGEGGSEMSVIRKDDEEGVVVRRKLTGGSEQVETLAFLPQNSVKDTTITLLDPVADKEWLQMVVTREPKAVYSLDDPKNLELPVMIKRHRDTTAEYTSLDDSKTKKLHMVRLRSNTYCGLHVG